MASAENEPPRVELYGSVFQQPAKCHSPNPLRIVKRQQKREREEGCRQPSASTDESEERGQKSSREDQHLIIMKRRGERSSLGASLDEETTVLRPWTVGNLQFSSEQLEDYQLGEEEGLISSPRCPPSSTLFVKKHRQRRRPLLLEDFGRVARTNGEVKERERSPARKHSQHPRLVSGVATTDSEVVLRSDEQKYRCEKFEPSFPFRRSSTMQLGDANSCNKSSFVLSPSISVTSETKGFYEGQGSVWVAIEVSGRLSQLSATCDDGNKDNNMNTCSFIDHELDRFFEFGCLYDLTVDILPASGTTIVQVLKEQTFPTTISAGSSILLLAQIQFDIDKVALPSKPPGHARSRSEVLIEDLEIHLGSSQVQYLQIRIRYSHSGFPESSDPEAPAGLSNLQSRMETTASATLKRHNTLSLWSPPPAPSPNPLFQLLERHWGIDKATEAMQKILVQRSTPRKPAKSASNLSLKENSSPRGMRGGHGPPPPPSIPLRQTSLQRPCNRLSSEIKLPARSHQKPPGYTQVPCPDMGSKTRRHVAASMADRHSDRWSWEGPSCSEGSGSPSRKRRTLGAEALRSLIPMMSDLNMSSGDGKAGRKRGSATVRSRGKEEQGLWNWNNWF